MPSLIGTAVPHNHMGTRLAVSIGNALIEPGVVAPTGDTYTFTRATDRVFSSAYPAWGGGNVSDPINFVHNGANFRVWQIIPFGGPAIGYTLGNASIHIRNRDKNRGQNLLTEMPDRITLTQSGWTGSPWEFTRTTSAAQFTNAGSGNAARKNVIYIPTRASVGASAAAVGVSGPPSADTFTVAFHYD